MNLIGLLVGLIILCLVFWCIRTLLAAFGVGEPISTVVMVVFVIIVVLWLLQFIGGFTLGTLGNVHVGR
jgi:hypothetical protein